MDDENDEDDVVKLLQTEMVCYKPTYVNHTGPT
jgi:hypothetical protein